MISQSRVERMLSDWGRSRRRDNDIDRQIFGTNREGWPGKNHLEKARRSFQQLGIAESRHDDGYRPPDPVSEDDVLQIDRCINIVHRCEPAAAKALEIKYVQRMTLRDAAKAMQCSVNAIRQALDRGHAMIRALLIA